MRLPALPEHPTLSVVIPAVDAAATLPRAVGSALGQRADGFVLADVVIAAGPSRDATGDVADGLAADHDRVTVVDNPAGNTPAALNLAVAASHGQVVARLDAHAVLPPGYLARAVATLRETGAANVGGRQVPTADAGFARAVATAMASPVGAGGATYRLGGDPGPVETVYLGVFRREALETVGGFDERLLRNQDYELNHRLRAAGATVWFDPALAVAYRPRGTAGGLARQYLDYGRWKRVVLRTHPSSLRLRQLAPPALLLVLLATAAGSLVAGLWWPLPALVAAYLLALLAAAVRADADPRRVWAVAAALAVMHLAWAIGFFLGARQRAVRGGPR